MTEATILAGPVIEAEAGNSVPVSTTDVLMTLIISFLAPMFLGASGGDVRLARLAAMETVSAYRARNPIDLVAVAQIIAFGLATLGSLSQSMVDDLCLVMTLRFRCNANSLTRSAELNRRAMEKSRRGTDGTDHAAPTVTVEAMAVTAAANEVQRETAVAAALQQAQSPLAEAQSKVAVAAMPAPSVVVPTTPSRPVASATSSPPAFTVNPACPATAAAPAPAVAAAHPAPSINPPSPQSVAAPPSASAIASPRHVPAAAAPVQPLAVAVPGRSMTRFANPAALFASPASRSAIINPAVSRAEQRHRAVWASAMADAAAELLAELPNSPPLARQQSTIRAAALGSSANELISGASHTAMASTGTVAKSPAQA